MVSETRVEAREEHQPLYVWQLPVRLTHWVHVGAMALLAISGYYIGAPFLDTSGYNAAQYSMGIMRFLHAVGATFLTLSFVVRIYWAIVGNSYARFQALLPTTRQKRRDFVGQLKYYLLLSTKRPDYVGHNPVAGISYVVLYILVFAQSLPALPSTPSSFLTASGGLSSAGLSGGSPRIMSCASCITC